MGDHSVRSGYITSRFVRIYHKRITDEYPVF